MFFEDKEREGQTNIDIDQENESSSFIDEVDESNKENHEQNISVIDLYVSQLKEKEEEILRLRAEFENFRKRAFKNTQEEAQRRSDAVLTSILPVFDNCSRAIYSQDAKARERDPLIRGLLMVLKQFESVLESMGLKKIDTVGKSFNHSIHEAVAYEEKDNYEPGVIFEEVLPGYMRNDFVLRYAQVKVSKSKEEGEKNHE